MPERPQRRTPPPRAKTPPRAAVPRRPSEPSAGVVGRPLRSRSGRRRSGLSRHAPVLVALLVAVTVLALGARQSGSASDADAGAHTSTSPREEEVGVVLEDRTRPTPFFGSHRSLQLYLPVPPESLTEIAFHQAAGDSAQHIDSLLPDADMTLAEEDRGTGRPDPVAPGELASYPGEEDALRVLGGEVLRMWRSNRTGPPDTAVDVGALAGTPVYSPVTGEVIDVRPYTLYGEHDDYEIHIRPTGWPELDVVLIHIDNPRVAAGDEVIGGITPIAEIRLLSDRITHQLSAYTTSGGDHVHVQINLLDNGTMPLGPEGS